MSANNNVEIPVLMFVMCLQGVKQTDHFGFICWDVVESGTNQYVCYVFQCASESLVSLTSCSTCSHNTDQLFIISNNGNNGLLPIMCTSPLVLIFLPIESTQKMNKTRRVFLIYR